MQNREQILIPKAGEAENFTFIQNTLNNPQADEIQIEVHFSALNFADVFIRLGLYPYAKSPPTVPGSEVAGVIVALGSEVKNFKKGDLVFAGVSDSAYSSHLNIPSIQVKKCPHFLTLEQACALPASFITAYVALVEMSRIRAGDRILIDCATGSLGHFLFEIAQKHEAHCVGLTTSPQKINLLHERGWEAYTLEAFEKTSLTNFNCIINSGGSKTVSSQFKRLAPFGKIIVLGATELIPKAKKNIIHLAKTYFKIPKFTIRKLMDRNASVAGINIMNLLKENPEKLAFILDRYNDYKIIPQIDKIFNYKDITKAHQYLEQKKSNGKILIRWK